MDNWVADLIGMSIAFWLACAGVAQLRGRDADAVTFNNSVDASKKSAE